MELAPNAPAPVPPEASDAGAPGEHPGTAPGGAEGILGPAPRGGRAAAGSSGTDAGGSVPGEESRSGRPRSGTSLAAIPLSLLAIPPRVRLALQQRGYDTVGDLARQPDTRLLATRGMGTRGLLSLVTELARVMADPAYQEDLLARAGRYDPGRFPDAVRNLAIDDLGLSQRAYRALRRAGVQTVGQLLELGEAGLRRLRGLGPRSLDEICHRLDALQSGRPLPPPGVGAGDPLAPELMDDPAPIAVLLLPRRVATALQRAGLHTVGAVAGFSQGGLRRLRGLGESGVAAILDGFRRYRQERSQRDAAPRDLEDWLRELVEPLADREREVLALRYGLLGAEPHDLAAIAARWQTTRQWVSVVQGRALRRARARARLDRFAPLVAAVQAAATRCGAAGPAELAEALRQEGTVAVPESADQAVRLVGLLVQVTPGLRRVAGSTWATLEVAQRLPEAARRLEAYLAETGRPASLAELAGYLAEHMPDAPASPEAMARAVLATQGAFGRFPGGLYGLASWRVGRRVRARDYVYQALERHGRPLHYAELTRLVNQLLPEGRKMPPTHVLTILSSGEPFRRFDRGIYGLTHWEREPERNLAGLCRDALAERGEPATLNQVVEAVQQQRRYPRRTVARALNEDPAVLRYGRDRFGLSAWLAADPQAAGAVRAPAYGPRPTNLVAVRGLLTELLAGHVYDTAQLTAYLGRWRQRSQARQIIAYLHAVGWLTGIDDAWAATPLNEAWVRAGSEPAQLAALALADPAFAHALVLHEAFRRLDAADGPDGTGAGEGPDAAGAGDGPSARTAAGAVPGAFTPAQAARWLAQRIRRAADARGVEPGPGFRSLLRRQWLVTAWFDPWVALLADGRHSPGPGGEGAAAAPDGDEPAAVAGTARSRTGTSRAVLWDHAARRLWPARPVHLPAAWLQTPATAWALLADAVAARQGGAAVDLEALAEWCREQGVAANPAQVEAELFALGLWPVQEGPRLRLYMPYRLVVPPEGLRLPGLPAEGALLDAAAEVLRQAGVLTGLPAGWPAPPAAEVYGVPPLGAGGPAEAAAHGEAGGLRAGDR
ncbi:sigma-70 region 4 domain protein [Thermaerobacter marianensis DSM 12885]|uniref:Sigma-70 region 4 domain protein n=1 Tax=Thermaerobacter marianensis (strain ATCC 700841 / DSM 12885 / JCM 10246 / 7p75a) TaxID=644966 RepID=E6SGL8_THEM7|nr:DNA-directed RNA polymerase subunit alpha C-terminal domain-containing protein [Thermaerobacter marianensis]ADU50564.1 sigma-70 region 4 domain protein [Thermaerobacter marianensis DSM 12885]